MEALLSPSFDVRVAERWSRPPVMHVRLRVRVALAIRASPAKTAAGISPGAEHSSGRQPHEEKRHDAYDRDYYYGEFISTQSLMVMPLLHVRVTTHIRIVDRVIIFGSFRVTLAFFSLFQSPTCSSCSRCQPSEQFPPLAQSPAAGG